MEVTFQEGHDPEPRYDPATLQKVIALAGRLQQQHSETYSADQIASLCTEVGLEPAFVRRALRQVAPAERVTAPGRLIRQRRREFKRMLAALAVPAIWSPFVYLLMKLRGPYTEFGPQEAGTLATLVLPPLISLTQGFIASHRTAARIIGVLLSIGLAPTFWEWSIAGGSTYHDAWVHTWYYLAGGSAILAYFGSLGVKLRKYYFPEDEAAEAATSNVLRTDVEEWLESIQTETAGPSS